MGSKLKRDLAFLLVALLVMICDQLTKFLIRSNMSPGDSIPSEGIVRLTYVTNTGGSFGLFANQTFLLIPTAIIGVAALFIYYRFLPFRGLLLKIGLGLLLGGAAGNLVDRVYLGHVIDFLDFGAWPVFNIADSAIVVGVAILVYFLLFGSKEKDTERRKVARRG